MARATSVASLLLFLFIAPSVMADGTETLGAPSIPIASGTGVAVGGVGLVAGQPAALSVDVPAGATVNQVILYWEGFNQTAAEFAATDTIQADGNDVTGDLIGGPTVFFSGGVSATYRADITALDLVGAGANSIDISISGLDFTTDNDGAGVLVIYDDGGTSAEIGVADGNDLAFVNFPEPLRSTIPQTFNFASASVPRFASVDLFVGSVAGGGGNADFFRPSSFEITTGGVTSIFPDQLDSIDGLFWDTISLGVEVPAGADSLTVQIFSRDDEVVAPGNLPASLTWLAGAVAVQTPERSDCWITTGGFHNSGQSSGSKDYTFGGNVGPPPRGSWEVIDHNTGDNFHSNDVSITSCEVVTLSGPDQPGGKKGFKINQASFEGTGRLNHVDGFPFTGFVQDAGEPHGKKGNDQDFFSIVVRDPSTNSVVFEASAVLDGGNVQIHPPTGKFKNN